ncbi:MAG: hypothetical protein ACD_60C00160G0026 [uncultured bacterium]|nr:MAG: hypothetical protein ACD_60C00160G0026 [uncultured bacterium]
MKLAFCLFKYFPFGGLQRDFLRIAKECVRRGHTVNVYTMAWDGKIEPDFSITVLSSKGWQNHTRIKCFTAQFQQEMLDNPHDLIVGFNKMPGLDMYYAADTCFQAKARAKHGMWYRLLPRYHHLIACERAIFAKDARTEILSISKIQQAEFIRCYETPLSRFHLLPPGIAKERIAPANADEIRAATRHAYHVKENQFLCVFVGSGFKTKGLDRVLLGMAFLPQDVKERTKLIVLGKDSPRIFKKQAKQLGIESQVIFLGGRDDVLKFMLAADLLVHPAYNENTGTVLLEALAAGLPVLTTDVCGYAHYITEADAGTVLPSPFQQNEFNRALFLMLTSKKQSHWQKNGLSFAAKADIYSMPERAVDLIESAMRHSC